MKAIHRSDLTGKDRYQKLAEGEFYFTEDFTMLVCFVPRVGIADIPLNTPDGWQWDGNIEKPTLTPSLNSKLSDEKRWHGHLTAGVWVECG